MNTWRALRALRRQRMATAVGVLITCALGALAFIFIPVTYSAEAQVLLLPSAVSTDGGPAVNPFLNISPALTATAQALAGKLTGDSAKRAMRDAGFDDSFTIAINSDTSGPVLVVDTPGSSPQLAIAAEQHELTLLTTTLRNVQVAAGAPAASLISLAPLAVATTATRVIGRQVRAVGAVVILGLLLTGWLAITLDGRKPEAVAETEPLTAVAEIEAQTERPTRHRRVGRVPSPAVDRLAMATGRLRNNEMGD